MALADERYISLTTFRRDGSAVSTPVWVVSDDGRRLLVWTGAATWKVKRLRRDARVLVAACDARGRPRGAQVEGTARIVEEGPLVERLLLRKYGVQKRALDAANRLLRLLRRRPRQPAAIVEIRLGRTAA